jgi:hypothetical protein
MIFFKALNAICGTHNRQLNEDADRNEFWYLFLENR